MPLLPPPEPAGSSRPPRRTGSSRPAWPHHTIQAPSSGDLGPAKRSSRRVTMPVGHDEEGTTMSEVALLFGHETAVHADELQVARLHPFSGADWPGRTVATILTQGCPWRCGYCNQSELQDAQLAGRVDWSVIRAHLIANARKLDGVVFSGGEPTRQQALVPAMQEARQLGYAVGIHSAGAYPGRLGHALAHADWLALDVKAMPEGYEDITGKAAAGAKAWESLALAIEWGGPLEVRLTVDPTTHSRDAVMSVVRRVVAMGGPAPVIQQATTAGTSEAFERALAGRGLKDILDDDDLAGLTVR